jgi:large subunit ribosomal protein L2
MGRLVRSQKKGKLSIYNHRFLKGRIRSTQYPLNINTEYVVESFTRSPKSKAVYLILENVNNPKIEKVILPAPIGARKGEVVNGEGSGTIIKKLSEYNSGDLVCNIQKSVASKKIICKAPGTCAKIIGFQKDKIRLQIKQRYLFLDPNVKAMKGRINCSDFWMKPILKAGTASKIQRANGKKYPKVSSTKMNVQDAKFGGSYRKRIGAPNCISRNAPPGSKGGYLAPKRTGKKKK